MCIWEQRKDSNVTKEKMNLLLIVLLFIAFSLIPILFPKMYKICVVVSVLVVFSSYFFISKNFFHTKGFFPSQEIQTYDFLWNHYNFITDALKNYRLSLIVPEYDKPIPESIDVYKTYLSEYISKDWSISALWDMSVYKGKIYMYFGITPVLLFYLPFNLITGMYLSDNFLCFVLACLIFMLSLFLIKKLTCSLSVYLPIRILTIFLVGFCNLMPFVLIRTSTYEAAIVTATFLLLSSLVVLYFYLVTKKSFLVLILGFLLSLCVGARPFYVLFIPAVFAVVCLVNYENNKDIKYVIKQAILFLIPCTIIGIGLALYNYLRFDSIFEFGFKYVLNYENHYEQTPTIKDALIAIKYSLFNLPAIDDTTFFSLAETKGHMFANGNITGILWTFPMLLSFVLLPKFLKDMIVNNKNIFYISILMIFVVCLNLLITSFIGSVTRYQFEYLVLIVILSIVIFYFYFNKINDKMLRNFICVVFIMVFVWSVILNSSLLLCKENFIYGDSSRKEYIAHITNFLF